MHSRVAVGSEVCGAVGVSVGVSVGESVGVSVAVVPHTDQHHQQENTVLEQVICVSIVLHVQGNEREKAGGLISNCGTKGGNARWAC